MQNGQCVTLACSLASADAVCLTIAWWFKESESESVDVLQVREDMNRSGGAGAPWRNGNGASGLVRGVVKGMMSWGASGQGGASPKEVIRALQAEVEGLEGLYR